MYLKYNVCFHPEKNVLEGTVPLRQPTFHSVATKHSTDLVESSCSWAVDMAILTLGEIFDDKSGKSQSS
jgi:hypothetical protein